MTTRDFLIKDLREYRATLRSLYAKGYDKDSKEVIKYKAKIQALESLGRKIS